MRKILFPVILACVLVSGVSCLDDVNKVTTPQAAITSFVVGYYNVRFHDKTWENGDTIVNIREAGVLYPMTIDQVRNRIYNIESLAFGSDVSAVTTSLSGTGTIVYSYSDDPEGAVYLWSGYDSINFTRPLVFSAISSDGSFKRDYTVQLNVHKVFPDSLLWSAADSTGFVPLENACAVILNDTLYNFGTDGSGVLSVVTKDIKAGSWSAPASLSGIPSTGWRGVVISCGNKLYAQSGSSVYGSSDGLNWTETKSGIKSLIRKVSADGKVWAVTADSSMVCTTDMADWTVLGKIPAGFPDSVAVAAEYPLSTNPSISRTVLAGIGSDSLYASVWTINSNDTVWVETDAPADAILRLPAMADFSMIRYDGHLFAFGAGLSDFRESSDNGITWYLCDTYADYYCSWNRYMQMPEPLRGYNGGFSYVVDRYGSIWIMTSDGQVWRGAITRLDKRAGS